MLSEYTVAQWKNHVWTTLTDVVSPEVPVTVTWRMYAPQGAQQGTVRLWAWPGGQSDPACAEQGLVDLAVGHILLDVAPCVLGTDFALAQTTVEAAICRVHEGERHLDLTLAYLEQAAPCVPAQAGVAAPVHRSPEMVLERMSSIMGQPGQWDATGCFHRAAALLHPDEPPVIVEDIGRHNCLDRLAGYACRHGVTWQGGALFVSARLTASLYGKARRAGFSTLISRSAVTTAAVDAARRDGVTLVGFCRTGEGRFTVFAE